VTYAVRTHYPVEMDKQELKDHVAAVVRARMDALGLSYRRAAGARAEDGGPNHSTVQQIAVGETNPKLATLAGVARYLRARWEVRLVGDEERPRLRSEERQKLLDRISAEIDVLLDHEVEHLAGMLRIYGEGRERGNQK